jgi:hypothetical protein
MGFKHYKCWFDSDLPSGNFLQFAIENDPVIDDLPINSMVIFHSYVNVYQMVLSGG